MKSGMLSHTNSRRVRQPKDIPVIFRMYQLNFNGDDDFVYQKYWKMYPGHFVEKPDLGKDVKGNKNGKNGGSYDRTGKNAGGLSL